MNPALKWFEKHLTLVVVLGVGVPCLIAAGVVMAVDRASYAAYEKQYDDEAAALRATFPAAPKDAFMDDAYVTYNADGSQIASSKSAYKKSFIYYARDAVVAPLSQEVAQEYEQIDDSYLGECITGLDRRGGAITFSFRTPTYGECDIAIAMKTNWVDEKGVYHELENLTDYINIQTNGLDVKTTNAKLPVADGYKHLILKDAHLIKGENTLTFTTNAYNTFGNKDDVLYIMPNIRNVALLTDVDVYSPVFEVNTDDFPTEYRLVERPDLSMIKIVKKIGDPAVSYAEEELDGTQFPSTIDYEAGKILIKCSALVTKEIAVTFDKSADANTIEGEVDGKQVTIVVTSGDSASITVDGASCTAKVNLTGSKGLASIKLIEKTDGDDDAYDALPKSFGMEYNGDDLELVLIKYFMSTTKANTGTGGTTGPSQTGNTYFAITNEEFLTAFWNWTWNGDECLALKCSYTINEGETSITLTKCLAYTRDEWQYLTNKTFAVSRISASEVPETLSSRLNIYE